MRIRSLLMSAALLPLTACFEVIIPGEPEPADLDNGEWKFNLEIVATDGDCRSMGIDIDDPHTYETQAWAYVETDDEDVSIDFEGLLLDGTISGDQLQADGDLYSHYDQGDPEPIEPDDGDHSDGSETDPAPSTSSSGGAPATDCSPEPSDSDVTLACEDYEPEEESIDASMDADILRSDRMEGSLTIDFSYYDTACTVEFEFTAEALGDDCDRPSEDKTTSASSAPSDGGEASSQDRPE